MSVCWYIRICVLIVLDLHIFQILDYAISLHFGFVQIQ